MDEYNFVLEDSFRKQCVIDDEVAVLALLDTAEKVVSNLVVWWWWWWCVTLVVSLCAGAQCYEGAVHAHRRRIPPRLLHHRQK